jgi:uncharacterized protein (DUF1778 family)
MAGKPKKLDQVKTYMLRVRMTEAERALLEEAARTKSLETSTWARSELVALARKILRDCHR